MARNIVVQEKTSQYNLFHHLRCHDLPLLLQLMCLRGLAAALGPSLAAQVASYFEKPELNLYQSTASMAVLISFVFLFVVQFASLARARGRKGESIMRQSERMR